MRVLGMREEVKLLRASFIGKKKALFTFTVLLFVIGTAIICLLEQRYDSVQTFSAEETGSIRLVIDPGHGGLDGGASAADGTTESVVNLSVALRMRELALFFGENPIMSRNSEILEYPETVSTIREKKVWDQKQRASLINTTENAVLISVHQNFYPDPRPRGPVVLYGAAQGSSMLAEKVQAALDSSLCPENRRVSAPVSPKIYLMNQINCPAILVECGFLSNPAEAEQLKSSAYQKKLALVLVMSYLQFASEDSGGVR